MRSLFRAAPALAFLAGGLMAQAIVTDLAVTGPVTSPALTIGAGINTMQYVVTYQSSLSPDGKLLYAYERSTDGGTNWYIFNGADLTAGPITKGANAGQVAISESSGQFEVHPGDKIRARIISAVGQVTTLAASINRTATTLTFPSAVLMVNGDLLMIDNEIVKIVSGGGDVVLDPVTGRLSSAGALTTSVTVTRAQNGTGSANHSAGAGVKLPWIINASITQLTL